MLLEAVPDLDMTGKEHTVVKGEIPNPISPPPGCTFHPRCQYVADRCRSEIPVPVPTPTGEAKCFAVEEGRI
jgi:peptide/nickel transport system ATP-binding protein